MLPSSRTVATRAAVRLAARLVRATRWTAPVLLPILLLLLSSPAAVEAASPPPLPYIPTTILLPGPAAGLASAHHDGFSEDLAFIFSPTASSVDLLSLNISTTLRASSIRPQTLTSGLPFLDRSSEDVKAFAPSILGNGTIAAYVGGCSSPDPPAVWTITPPNSTDGGASPWLKHGPPPSENSGWERLGPSMLGGAVSFSSQLEPTVSPASFYVYGGMCPSANGSDDQPWTTAAYYNNHLVKLSPLAGGAYNISPILSKGVPVAGAGFTFTPLTPSVSNRSGIVTQQVNNVVLGGHSYGAFINMSRAALWSLPEEAWSFVPIEQPAPTSTAGSKNTELTVRKGEVAARALSSSVESRSGHTAVLSADGNYIIVLGGWVGDTSQAAQPQLAVLEMGNGFEDWKWTVPSAQPSGPGIFGHGAILLPGNVMMVYGGYGISASTSKLKARQVDENGGVAMFLNLTSMAWTSDYTNPAYAATGQSEVAAGSSSPSSRDIGLGVGLGVGLAVLIGIALAFFIIRRRRQKRHRARDSAMRSLAQDANMFLPEDPMMEHEEPDFFGWGSEKPQQWYTGGGDPYTRGAVAGPSSAGRSLGYESLRGSRISPTFYPPARKPGTPRNARGLYIPTPGSQDGSPVSPPRAPRGPGQIHPIYEADEDGDPEPSPSPPSVSPDSKEMDDASDPFRTPVSATAGNNGFGGRGGDGVSGAEASMSGARQQHPEVQDWVSDVDTTDAVLSAHIGPHNTTTTKGPAVAVGGASGSRAAPARRVSARSKPGLSPSSTSFVDEEGRTVSNLSDSNRSAFSYAPSQTGSSRPGTSTGIVALATTVAAAGPRDDDRRLESSSSSTGGNSFNTARSTFAALQAEGPALLAGGGGEGARPLRTSLIGGVRSTSPEEDEEYDAPGSPSKSKDRRSWLGSLRRVFSTSRPGSGLDQPSGETSRNDSPHSFEGGDYEPRLVGLGGMLMRRKQGREAWEAGDADDWGLGTSSGAGGGPTTAEASGSGGYRGLRGAAPDDEWDIERAVEQRLVQVMFTVPKERLRVVNAEIEKEEEVEIVDPDREGEEEYDEKTGLASSAAESMDLIEKTASQRSAASKGKEKAIYAGKQGVPVAEAAERSGTAAARPGGDEWDPFWDGPAVHPKSCLGGLGREGGAITTSKLTPAMVRVPTPPELKGKTLDDFGNVVEALDQEDSSDVKGVSAVADNSRLSQESSHVIMTAEAVRLKRPSTRVLDMVDQIETLSRSSSPSRTGTPTRTGSPSHSHSPVRS